MIWGGGRRWTHLSDVMDNDITEFLWARYPEIQDFRAWFESLSLQTVSSQICRHHSKVCQNSLSNPIGEGAAVSATALRSTLATRWTSIRSKLSYFSMTVSDSGYTSKYHVKSWELVEYSKKSSRDSGSRRNQCQRVARAAIGWLSLQIGFNGKMRAVTLGAFASFLS